MSEQDLTAVFGVLSSYDKSRIVEAYERARERYKGEADLPNIDFLWRTPEHRGEEWGRISVMLILDQIRRLSYDQMRELRDRIYDLRPEDMETLIGGADICLDGTIMHKGNVIAKWKKDSAGRVSVKIIG